MPNVTLDDPNEASLVALVNCHDQRLREIAGRHSALETFLNAFRNEFGTPICPTIGMMRESTRQNFKTTAAFGGFRDLTERWRLWPRERFFARSPLLASPFLRPARFAFTSPVVAPFLPPNALIDHETRSRNEPATISAGGALPWGRI